jgi:creatinine amidohydrolase
MELHWENLTAPDFARAVEQTQGTCIVPLGVIEKHGTHLPLGTDMFTSRATAEAAVQIEPAVIFPPYYLTAIHEAKHQPGTIAIDYRLMFDLLENCCREIARNGLRRILLLNGHGGNGGFLHCFADMMLEKPRDYTLYIIGLGDYLPSNDPKWKAMMQTPYDHHAGEYETSTVLASHPQFVKMDQITDNGQAQKRSEHIAGLKNSITWYAEYPNHYAGDARPATAEKGRYLMDCCAHNVAKLIAKAKSDTLSPQLLTEFHARTRH